LIQVGEFFGVSYATVSRAVKQAEKGRVNVKCKADPNLLSVRDTCLKEVAAGTARLELALISHLFTIANKNGAFLLTIIYPLKFLIELTITITAVKKLSSQLV
jgi:hypothetical protein